ncbi:uncharacterized protein [Dysidea avara]|uniref:uncharacterized protein n=1 Tax=Dysidea avara TaxID=196820 RepID=UPI0033174FBF
MVSNIPSGETILVEGAVVIDQIENKDVTPKMRDLNRYVVRKYAANWKDIGIELGLEFDVLNMIEKDNPQQSDSCLQITLDRWLRSTHNATWKTLEVVLTNVRREQLGLDPVDDVYVSSDSYIHAVEGSLVRQHAQYSTKEWIKPLLVFCIIIVVFVVCMYRFTNWPDIVLFVSFW